MGNAKEVSYLNEIEKKMEQGTLTVEEAEEFTVQSSTIKWYFE